MGRAATALRRPRGRVRRPPDASDERLPQRRRGVARLRRPDRRRRPPRGRDRARPRLGRRRRRAHLRPPRRPDRQGDRPRHDRRDARARPRQRRARPASRTSSSSRATSRTMPLPDATRRRRDLQLRDQPRPATSRRCIREAARVLRPGGRFAVSDVIADPDMDDATRPTWPPGPAASPARSPRPSSAPRSTRAGFERRRDPRDPPRPRARRRRDHPRPQAVQRHDGRASSSTTRRRSTGAGRTRSGPRSTIDLDRRPASSGREMGGDRTEALIFFVLSSLMVAEERITTKFSGLVGAHGERGGGDVPRHPAGRRGAPHAVLRALPGRGRSPSRRRSPPTSSAPREQVSDAFRQIFDDALVAGARAARRRARRPRAPRSAS